MVYLDDLVDGGCWVSPPGNIGEMHLGDFNLVLLAGKYPVWIPNEWSYAKITNTWIKISVPDESAKYTVGYFQGIRATTPQSSSWVTVGEQTYLMPAGASLNPTITETSNEEGPVVTADPISRRISAEAQAAFDAKDAENAQKAKETVDTKAAEAARDAYWKNEGLSLDDAQIVESEGKGNKEDYVLPEGTDKNGIIDRIKSIFPSIGEKFGLSFGQKLGIVVVLILALVVAGGVLM